MLKKIVLAASVAMLIGTTAAVAQYGYGNRGYGYGYYGDYGSNARNNDGGAGHHTGETNGF